MKELLPGWETVEKIGGKSFYPIYKIKKIGEKEVYSALKFNEILYSSIDESDASRGSALRFAKEVEINRKLKGKKNILSSEDEGIESDSERWFGFIRMELADVLPLEVQRRQFSAEEVIKLGIDVCLALEQCHELNIIHRDVKPHNIFYCRSGEYKLGDFGAAYDPDFESEKIRIGTLIYIAPEVYRGDDYGFEVDIYSLGMTLYWLLNERKQPFWWESKESIPGAKNDYSLRTRMSGKAIPAPKNGCEGLINIVLKACAFNPADRYHTATEFKLDLEKLLNSMSEEEKKEIVLDAIYIPDTIVCNTSEIEKSHSGTSEIYIQVSDTLELDISHMNTPTGKALKIDTSESDTVEIKKPQIDMKELLHGWETVEKIGGKSFYPIYKIKKIGENDVYSALKFEKIFIDESDACENLVLCFTNEVKISQKLKGKKNILFFEDGGTELDGDRWSGFIRMELADALHLEVEKRLFSAEEVVKLGIDVCSALEQCHELNIIHRDVKPHNIFYCRSGEYKLGDFGAAYDPDLESEKARIGTPLYIAPEVYRGDDYGSEVDIYSLGMTLYWLLNDRKQPFLWESKETDYRAKHEEAFRTRMSGKAIPAPKNGCEGLINIVLKACAFNPADRYHTATEFKLDLEKLLNSMSEEEKKEIVLDAIYIPDTIVCNTSEIKISDSDKSTHEILKTDIFECDTVEIKKTQIDTSDVDTPTGEALKIDTSESDTVEIKKTQIDTSDVDTLTGEALKIGTSESDTSDL